MPSAFADDELIRMALVQWWHGDARLGMTATEMQESLFARLAQRGIEIRVIPIQRPEYDLAKIMGI